MEAWFMKISELRQKAKKELETVLKEDREKLRQLRFDLAAGKVKNVREVRRMKKEIARALTLLTQAPQSGAKGEEESKALFD